MYKWLKMISSWTGSLAAAFLLSFLFNAFVVQPTKVMGHSMEPTLNDHSRIYVAKWNHVTGGTWEYGDIIVIDSRIERERTMRDNIMEYPLVRILMGGEDKKVFWVKRVIGKSGDILEIRENQVYRNGELISEPYLKEKMATSFETRIEVPKGYIYVMGDNRNHSKDSRAIGAIPLDHVIGKKL